MSTEIGPTLREEQASILELFRENNDQHGEADYLERIFPDEPDIGEMVYTRDTFESCQAVSYGEMTQAAVDAKIYWDFLDKYPELTELGFSEDDVYDPTQK